MSLYPDYVATKKCSRCELLFKKQEPECTHCGDLTDIEVIDLKLKYEKENKGNTRLGKYFIFISFLLLLGFVFFLD